MRSAGEHPSAERNQRVTIDTPARVQFSSRQRLILLVLLGAGFLLAIDYSILHVALPTIGAAG